MTIDQAALRGHGVRAFVLAVALTAARPALAEGNSRAGDSDQTRVVELVDQAKLDFAAGMAHDALLGFREAWALAKTPEVAANLAIVEAGFGHHRDAAEHFRFALLHLSARTTAAQRRAVAAGLDAEKAHVLTLKVESVPVTAHIAIDGQVSTGALSGDELYVEPGRHQIHADAPGYQSITLSIDGAAGITLPVQVELQPIDGRGESEARAHAQLSGAPPSASAIHDSHSPSTLPLIVGGSLAVVGVTLGTIFLVKAGSASDEVSNARSALPGDSACSPGTNAVSQCNALHDAIVSQNRDQNIGTAGLVVAGAATVGTLLYWLWPRSQNSSAATAYAVVSPGYAAVRASWAW
jgi:hypothetical protein